MVEPRLLVLRLWPGQTPFRAVVREFEPERSLLFDDPQALIEFVLQPLAPRGQATTPRVMALPQGRPRTEP